MSILPGMFAVPGSIIGGGLGRTGLYVGAVLGGLIGVTAATRISLSQGWISRAKAPSVQVASIAGFLIAAVIAGNNLWTPIIPIASTCIIGIAALLAARGDSVPTG